MPLKTNRIKFKVAVCGQYLGYDRSNEGPLVFLHCYFVCLLCLLAYVACVAGRVASRTSDLQDVLSFVAVTASLRDSWVSFTIWSAQRSGGRPLGRCHVEGTSRDFRVRDFVA